MRDSFYFGIPLISAAAANDWQRVNQLLRDTLHSVQAQEDGNFRVIIVGDDAPIGWREGFGQDERFVFVAANAARSAPTGANDDAGVKRWMIRKWVKDAGGGLLMLLDADDLVDRATVRMARERMRGDVRAAVIGKGVAIDWVSGYALELPHAEVYEGAFHTLCGSSTIARIAPNDDPFDALGSHHRWPENAAEQEIDLIRLPLWGGYRVNSDQNHSETHGPYAAWRQWFNRAVVEHGAPLSPALQHRLAFTA
ncbi:MAG: hypothetical protein CMN72_16640 [Sphingomonas sp.]|nr:hypothetical protein [Sphingomonas sp.]